MKASAAFETKAWRTDAEGRCCKDRPDKGGEYETATGKTGTAGTCNQTSLLYSERCLVSRKPDKESDLSLAFTGMSALQSSSGELGRGVSPGRGWWCRNEA
jgi:hypothetical protein